MKKIISTSDAPAAVGPYSQAVRVGSTIYCAGQIPLDPKSGQIVSGGIDLSIGSVVGLGAVTLGLLLERGWSPWRGLATAIASISGCSSR